METTATGTTSAGNSPSDSALNKASTSAHAKVNSITEAADDAARKAEPAIDRMAAMAHQAVDKVAGGAGPAADWLAGQGESLNATQKKLVEDTCNYVSANPLKAVGMALAAGFLISRIIR